MNRVGAGSGCRIFEDFACVFDNSVFSDIFIEVRHPQRNYGSKAGENSKGLKSGELKLLVFVFYKI